MLDYQSRRDFERFSTSDIGKAYWQKHWEIFSPISHSLIPQFFQGIVAENQAYYLRGGNPEWHDPKLVRHFMAFRTSGKIHSPEFREKAQTLLEAIKALAPLEAVALVETNRIFLFTLWDESMAKTPNNLRERIVSPWIVMQSSFLQPDSKASFGKGVLYQP